MEKTKVNVNGRVLTVNAEKLELNGEELLLRELLLSEVLDINEAKTESEKVRKQIICSIASDGMSLDDKVAFYETLTARDSLVIVNIIGKLNEVKVNPLS